MKIEKLRKFSLGLTKEEEDVLLKKKGCRRLTLDEFVDGCQSEEYNDYLPCRLETPGGFAARGYDDLSNYNYRRYVVLDYRLSYRFGVLGVKIEKKKNIRKK